MTTWDPRANDLFLKALELPPNDRRELLDRECAGDSGLRAEVESLLEAAGRAGRFLEGSPTVTVDMPIAERPGTMIGPYKLLEEIGEGGMGVVFMAEQHEPVRRKVALKVIKPGMDTRQVVARFEQERQALALMDHPNIARVLDAGATESGPPYFVMELIRGLPITAYCDQERFTPRERLELFVPICRAVQHAHQKGVIHRDLKPSNVLVTLLDGKPVVKVIDFGVAKAAGQPLTDKTLFTNFAQMVGTTLYMSPEQAAISGQDVDTRSDVYSLGVLLYELLTGGTPFDRERFAHAAFEEIRRIIREEDPPKPSTRVSTADQQSATASAHRRSDAKRLGQTFRGELDWIVMKCLEKDRNRRYETASGLGQDIERYLADEPVQACPPSMGYRLRRIVRRNKRSLAAASAIGLALLVAVGTVAGSIGWATRDKAARQADIERAEMARLVNLKTQVRDSFNATRALIAENKLTMARVKLTEARAMLANDRSALGNLAAEVDAGAADLDRFQQFLDLIDQAHEAETAPIVNALAETDNSGGNDSRQRHTHDGTPTLQRAEAAGFLLKALHQYVILERLDWNSAVESSFLGGDQAKIIRRNAYEELLWLAEDVLERRQDHRTGGNLTHELAARAAVIYLGKAESARQLTQAYYSVRARCHKFLGNEAAFQADQRLAEATPPTLALDHYLRGQSAFHAGRLAEGVRAFEAALRLEPTHYWSMMKLGWCLCDLGEGPPDYTAAVHVFTGCIMKRPNHAHAYYCRAIAYGNLHRNDEAIADNRRAIELDPKHAAAHNNLGFTLYAQKKVAEAIASYRESIVVDPEHAGAHYGLGNALKDQKKLDEALECYHRANEFYRRANKLHPKLAEVYHRLAEVFAAKGQAKDEIDNYRRALDVDPKSGWSYCMLGEALVRNGQADEAIRIYREGLGAQPTQPRLNLMLGMALSEKGEVEEAIKYCRKAVDLAPEWDWGGGHVAKVLSKFGRHDDAIKLATEMLTRRKAKNGPDHPDTLWCMANVADRYIDMKRPADAVKILTEMLEVYRSKLGDGTPAFLQQMYDVAIVYRRYGLFDEAIKLNAELLRLAKDKLGADDPMAFWTMGNLATCYAAVNRPTEAQKLFEDVIAGRKRKLGPDHEHTIQAMCDLAFFHGGSNRIVESVKIWEEILMVVRTHFPAGDSELLDTMHHFAWYLSLVPNQSQAQLDRAVDMGTKATNGVPTNPHYRGNLGCVRYRAGQFAEAIADLEKAIGMCSPNDGRTAWEGFVLAMAYWKVGDKEKARSAYDRALKVMTDTKESHQELHRFRSEAEQLLGIRPKKE